MRLRRFAYYSFAITFLWLGFVCALSFLEAPLKFKAPGVELKQALSIGRLVFQTLNRVEWVCAIFSWLLVMRLSVVRTRGTLWLLGLITVILAFQTWGLLPPLEERTIRVLGGEELASSWHHHAYIILEVVKAFSLAVLASLQVQSFARAVISE